MSSKGQRNPTGGHLLPTEPESAGDPFPSDCRIIEVHVAELRQLFNAIDPSPFHERDLDPQAEEFIVGWSKDLPSDAPLGLLVYLDSLPARRTSPRRGALFPLLSGAQPSETSSAAPLERTR
jgi:hypothetical protein